LKLLRSRNMNLFDWEWFIPFIRWHSEVWYALLISWKFCRLTLSFNLAVWKILNEFSCGSSLKLLRSRKYESGSGLFYSFDDIPVGFISWKFCRLTLSFKLEVWKIFSEVWIPSANFSVEATCRKQF
jgi:hypothetical protein